MSRLIPVAALSALTGAALVAGVMLWAPWEEGGLDGLDPARCEAATIVVQEARQRFSAAPHVYANRDRLDAAIRQWERECNLE